MQIIAFILALIAVFCFLGAAYYGYGTPTSGGPAARWHLGWLGLAFLTVAWMVQIIITTGGRVSVH